MTRELFGRTPVCEGAARATWKTRQNDVLGTYAYTDNERHYGPTGTKCPSVAEVGTLATKNCKKLHTSHVRVHETVHGPKTAGTVTRVFFLPDARL